MPGNRSGHSSLWDGRSGRSNGLPHDRVLITAITLMVLLAGWYALDLTGFAGEVIAGLLVSLVLNALGTVAAWRVARLLLHHPARRFWVTMVFTGLMFTLADLVQLFVPVGDPVTVLAARGSGLPPLFMGAGTAALVVVVLTYRLNFTDGQDRLRFWLDMLTVLVATGAFTIYLAGTERPDGGAMAWVDALLGPITLFVCVFALARLLLRGTVLFVLGTGLAGVASAASGGAVGLLGPVVAGTGKESALLWLSTLGSAFFLLAMRIQLRSVLHDPERMTKQRSRSYSTLPYLAIVATYALLLTGLHGDGLTGRTWAVLIAVGIIGLLVIMRQIASFQENVRLLSRLRAALGQRDVLAAELRRMAFYDDLTGLANRPLFTDRLEHACHQVRRDGSALAVVLLDLDDFKPINDRYGHAVGDALLAEIGSRLREVLRTSDTVARLGGDEFAVLLHNPMPDRLPSVALRIATALTRPCTVEGHVLRVTTSIGIAVDAGGHPLPDRLLREADRAMYKAKQRRKGGFEIVRSGTPSALASPGPASVPESVALPEPAASSEPPAPR